MLRCVPVAFQQECDASFSAQCRSPVTNPCSYSLAGALDLALCTPASNADVIGADTTPQTNDQATLDGHRDGQEALLLSASSLSESLQGHNSDSGTVTEHVTQLVDGEVSKNGFQPCSERWGWSDPVTSSLFDYYAGWVPRPGPQSSGMAAVSGTSVASTTVAKSTRNTPYPKGT